MRLAALLSALACAACATQQLQPGPDAPRAIVRADPLLNAGLPVRVRLRRVDDTALSWRASAAELPAGWHRLLVDCHVAATRSTRRFTLDVELEAGREYRLVARTSARDCDGVELLPR